MSCFNVWIVPKTYFEQDAQEIAYEFGILMDARSCYDEYPAFKFELDLESNFFVRLLGPPSNVEDLIEDRPREFSSKDRNYRLTVCSHTGLPVPSEVRESFPGSSPAEFGLEITKRLKSLGFKLFKNKLPYTTTDAGPLFHHELIEEDD
jgi:hypothetical protein